MQNLGTSLLGLLHGGVLYISQGLLIFVISTEWRLAHAVHGRLLAQQFIAANALARLELCVKLLLHSNGRK